MTPSEIKSIEDLFDLKFEKHKSEMHTELQHFRTVLNKHEMNATISSLEIHRKIDSIHTLLQGTEYDSDSGLMARFKKIEAMMEVLKTDKQFMKGGWWVAGKLLAIIVGTVSFVILVINFFKNLWT
jgi:REP element-mobilizing transposase RayT